MKNKFYLYIYIIKNFLLNSSKLYLLEQNNVCDSA